MSALTAGRSLASSLRTLTKAARGLELLSDYLFITTDAEVVQFHKVNKSLRRFTEEARRIHYGERPSRGIRGHATVEQRAELLDEGLEIITGLWRGQPFNFDGAHYHEGFRSLLDAGVTLAFGSDWTVAPIEPLLGIYAAVTRRTLDGKHPEGWIPDQKITVAEAVRAYTVGSAYAEFADSLGSFICCEYFL